MLKVTFSTLDYSQFDRKAIRAAMGKAVRITAKHLKDSVNRHGTGQRYSRAGRRKQGAGASAPGTPPARQTGALWRSIKGRASRRGYAFLVSALAPHAHLLELGTVRTAQRPAFAPSFAAQADAIRDLLREAVGSGLIVTSGSPDQPPPRVETG